jgi:hypothetical protein
MTGCQKNFKYVNIFLIHGEEYVNLFDMIFTSISLAVSAIPE